MDDVPGLPWRFSGADLVAGIQYRMWWMMDYLGSVDETDEGDNLVPTARIFRR